LISMMFKIDMVLFSYTLSDKTIHDNFNIQITQDIFPQYYQQYKQ